jgi:SAM-dependent methyltransferase
VERELFEAHARVEQHHWWFTARRSILQALVHAVAPAGSGVPLADVGCGTGGNVAAFGGEYDVLGIDTSAVALALARAHHPAVRFVQSDDPMAAAEHLATGGVLLMTDVLEHVKADQDLFDRALDAVPVGANLVITVPNDPALWSSHDEIFGHSRRYTLATFRTLWRDASVEERLLSPYNSRLHGIVSMIRRVRRRHVTRPGGDLALSAGPLNGLLRTIFAGEAKALVAALDRGSAPFSRGVSLVAVLRKV